MIGRKLKIGKVGENAAALYLTHLGMTIKARGYRSGRGELDIVADDDGTLVIIEVKTSTGNLYGDPIERVDEKKQQQLIRLAYSYIAEYGIEDAPVRFDVVGVVCDGHGHVKMVKHIRDAFIVENDD